MNCMVTCMPRQRIMKGYGTFNSLIVRCLYLIVRILVDTGRHKDEKPSLKVLNVGGVKT